jgi:hypothetical protein
MTERKNLSCRLVLLVLLSHGVLLALPGCPAEEAKREGGIDPAPFKEMAKGAICADESNRLFVIDGKMVLWRRSGNCPDNAYATVLFGKTPKEVLCRVADSIAGPQKSCVDAEAGKLFDVILNNLDKKDLGLGPEHKVEPIEL